MPPDPIPLTPTQLARRGFARYDLDAARTIDLAALGEPGLILLVERLRGRLDDTLALLDELTTQPRV
ncbi:hypothetical protein [Streptomyces sp. NPDC014685]|uniref:hypothetical protein n=1 Tax=Streptomyces sp. NPDC014685 TaxID=3364881 RepID=UPI0036F5D592